MESIEFYRDTSEMDSLPLIWRYEDRSKTQGSQPNCEPIDTIQLYQDIIHQRICIEVDGMQIIKMNFRNLCELLMF